MKTSITEIQKLLAFQHTPDAFLGWLFQNYPFVAILLVFGMVVWFIKGTLGKYQHELATVKSEFKHLEDKVDDLKSSMGKMDEKIERIIQMLIERK